MIYFDNAATTNPDKDILQAYGSLLNEMFMNTSSVHKGGQESSRLLNKAREQIAGLFHVLPEEVIFTSGATESNNMAIKGYCFRYQNRGKHIITSAIEHPSVLNTCRQLHDYFDFDLTILPVTSKGTVDPEELKKAMRDDTILVSIMAVNNEVGAINDVKALSEIVHQFPKAVFHCDTTQAIGKIDVDFSCIDMFVLSAHKLYGLKGSGALIKKKKIDLLPLLSGGGQEYNLRSGTNDFQKEVILAKTIRLALSERQNNYDHCKMLFDYAYQKLNSLNEDLEINSLKDESPFILNFSLLHKKGSVVVEGLSEAGIMVSTTSACSSKKEAYSHVLEAMGKTKQEFSNSVRLSFCKYNTKEEIDVFFDTLVKLINRLKDK